VPASPAGRGKANVAATGSDQGVRRKRSIKPPRPVGHPPEGQVGVDVSIVTLIGVAGASDQRRRRPRLGAPEQVAVQPQMLEVSRFRRGVKRRRSGFIHGYIDPGATADEKGAVSDGKKFVERIERNIADRAKRRTGGIPGKEGVSAVLDDQRTAAHRQLFNAPDRSLEAEMVDDDDGASVRRLRQNALQVTEIGFKSSGEFIECHPHAGSGEGTDHALRYICRHKHRIARVPPADPDEVR
jgi:hypothetical protein